MQRVNAAAVMLEAILPLKTKPSIASSAVVLPHSRSGETINNFGKRVQ